MRAGDCAVLRRACTNATGIIQKSTMAITTAKATLLAVCFWKKSRRPTLGQYTSSGAMAGCTRHVKGSSVCCTCAASVASRTPKNATNAALRIGASSTAEPPRTPRRIAVQRASTAWSSFV